MLARWSRQGSGAAAAAPTRLRCMSPREGARRRTCCRDGPGQAPGGVGLSRCGRLVVACARCRRWRGCCCRRAVARCGRSLVAVGGCAGPAVESRQGDEAGGLFSLACWCACAWSGEALAGLLTPIVTSDDISGGWRPRRRGMGLAPCKRASSERSREPAKRLGPAGSVPPSRHQRSGCGSENRPARGDAARSLRQYPPPWIAVFQGVRTAKKRGRSPYRCLALSQ